MRFLKDHKGFSLVEMIIVVGIIGIVAGASLTMIGHLRSANTEKIVQNLSTELNKLQANTMGKKEKKDMYLFKKGGLYYMCLVQSGAALDMEAQAVPANQLGSGDLTVSLSKNGAAAAEIGEGESIMIRFNRSGAFSVNSSAVFSATDITSAAIIIKGSVTYKVTLNRETGKNIVSVE